MKTTSLLLVMLFSAYCSVGLARSDDSQQLRRYDPQTQSIEQAFGQEKMSVNFDRAIAKPTMSALINYMSQHFVSSLMSLEIDKLPGADNIYAVTGAFTEARNSTAHATLLLLREQGGKVSEVSKLSDETAEGYGVISPVFFYGKDRMLVIVSMSSADGDARMDLAYEYTGNNLKPLGQIEVIEKMGESNGVWRIDSPVKRATAEYKNGAYFVTLRGKGSLHLGGKKIAAPGAPVTFYYNGKAWRQVSTKPKARS
jgi:hypothetical protein